MLVAKNFNIFSLFLLSNLNMSPATQYFKNGYHIYFL